MILFRLFFTFFKIGLVGFGGGMAILPLIYQSVLEFTNMDPDTFANLFAISQATPGPMAINAATFVGYQVAGLAGAAAATLGVSTPSFILVAIVFKFVSKNKENRLVDGAFTGIRPATVGMIAAAATFVGGTAVFKVELADIESLTQLVESIDVIPAIMAAAAFVLAWKFKVGAIKLIFIMAALGTVLCSGMF